MKGRFWIFVLIGSFAIATVPINALAENEPPTWELCYICPIPTTDPTIEPPTDPIPICPEQPPADEDGH